jgi:hypothetical protein
MEPGSFVTVIIEDGAIVLEPIEDAAEGEACASPAATAAAEPPVATLAAVA